MGLKRRSFLAALFLVPFAGIGRGLLNNKYKGIFSDVLIIGNMENNFSLRFENETEIKTICYIDKELYEKSVFGKKMIKKYEVIITNGEIEIIDNKYVELRKPPSLSLEIEYV